MNTVLILFRDKVHPYKLECFNYALNTKLSFGMKLYILREAMPVKSLLDCKLVLWNYRSKFRFPISATFN